MEDFRSPGRPAVKKFNLTRDLPKSFKNQSFSTFSVFKPSKPPLMHINIIFDVVGTHISRYDCHFRAYDGYLEGPIAPNWAQLALIWGQLAANWANLGPTCTNLEPTLAQLASIWRQLRPTCYHFGVDAPDFACKRGKINVKINVFSLVFPE